MTPAGYVHAGFVEYIGRRHEALAGYDARFDWPAFFAAGAVLVHMAGLPDALPLLTWAPIFFELLALAPMLLLARSVLGRARPAWLAVVLYYAGSWFAQDYFSPQAAGHLLYLSSMAVLFWTISGRPAGRPPESRPPESRPPEDRTVAGRTVEELRYRLVRRPESPPGLSDTGAW